MKLQEGSSITCLVCNQTSENTSENTSTATDNVKKLPGHPYLSSVADKVTTRQKIQRDEAIQCDMCVRGKPATSICVECSTFQCEECSEFYKYSREHQGHHMMMLKEIRSEKKDVTVQPKPKPMLCEEHDMELNFYCETCEQLVCHHCTTTEHRLEDGHKHNTVKKMANKQRAELNKMMEPVEKMIDGLAKAHEKVSAARDKIGSQATEVDQQIGVYYGELQQRINQQRNDLMKELREVSTQKKKAVSLQLKQLEYAQAQLENVKELSEAVKSGSDQEVLFVKKQVAEDVKRLTSDYNKLNTEPVELANMEFIQENWSIPLLGNMFHGNDSFNTIVSYYPPDVKLGQEVKWSVVTKDENRHPCSKGINTITVQAQSRTELITVPITDNEDGSYTASFVPGQTGKLTLTVMLNDNFSSCCTYQVCPYYEPNKIVSNDGMSGEPRGIAFGKDGIWAVVYYTGYSSSNDYNDCVCIYNMQCYLIRKIESRNCRDAQFRDSRGLAFDANNHLYVVDSSNSRVLKFNINGGYLLQFGKHGSGDGMLYNPSGITAHDDRIFVAYQGNNKCIAVFHCDGQFIHTIGSGQLSSPRDVAVTNNNQLLVADRSHHCISIFTLDGNYVGKIGTQGSDRDQLSNPTSVTVDKNGFIMVVTENYICVSVFDKDGVFLYRFGSSGSNAGQFRQPQGIACSPNGSVYVSDGGNKRIQIFSDY